MKAADGPQLRENDMMIRRYLAGATLSVALTIANPVKADLLGGNANGALSGTLSGRMGDISGMADGRAAGSIGAQPDVIDRVGKRTGDFAGRVKSRGEATAATARDRSRSTADEARGATAAASVQAVATGTAGVSNGAAAANGSLETIESAQLDAAGGADHSVSAGKSVAAGDRTVDAIATGSAQGAAGVHRDSDAIDLTGAADAQSAAAVKTGRKTDDPARTTDRTDHR